MSLGFRWCTRVSQRPGCGDDLQSLTDELNSVAEAMWKDELSKGIKPNASAVAAFSLIVMVDYNGIF